MNSGETADASLLADDTVLRPDSAVAAILLDPDGRYLLQLRDRKRGIFFPDYWGFFGGAVEKDDADDATTLRRELSEELGIDFPPEGLAYFTRYTFDMAFCGGRVIYRTFYEARLTREQVAALRLAEGQRWGAFVAVDIMEKMRMTPYDAFALWMHVSRSRLEGRL